jgi:hypothetical protein
MRGLLLGFLALSLVVVAAPLASAHGDGCALHTDLLPDSAVEFAGCLADCAQDADAADLVADTLAGEPPCGIEVGN